MNGRNGLFVFGAGLLATLALVGASGMGCQNGGTGTGGTASNNGGNTSQGTTTNSGGSGTGGSGTMSTSTSTASNTGGSTTTSTTSSTGTGSNCTFDMEASSIEDLTKGTIGPGVKVKLTGVIAMSTMYKVSGPGSSGSCLWGVYLSEPGLTTTKEYSGIIGLSYGDDATTNDAGKMFCPVPPLDPANSAFPEDIQPGDELTVIGKTSLFPTMDCGTPQVQLANICSVTKTASGKPTPTPAVLSSSVATALAGSDPDIHNKWGGVKVEIDSVDSVDPQDCGCPPTSTCTLSTTIVDGCGAAHLADGLQVNDSIYYQGLLAGSFYKKTCHSGFKYPDPVTHFDSIKGFITNAFCTWSIYPASKCDDLTPADSDCTGGCTDCMGGPGKCN